MTILVVFVSCSKLAEFSHATSGLEIGKNYNLPYFYFLAGQTNFGLPFMFFDLPLTMTLCDGQKDEVQVGMEIRENRSIDEYFRRCKWS